MFWSFFREHDVGEFPHLFFFLPSFDGGLDLLRSSLAAARHSSPNFQPPKNRTKPRMQQQKMKMA